MSIGFTPPLPNLPHDAQIQERKEDADKKLAQSQGLGGSKESEKSSEDRDADGRQMWQWTLKQKAKKDEENDRKVKDISGNAGNNLDLSG
ncbi:MAG: hypothetical protein FWE67_09685 [Planctomycetaceae bacterium]|nr:hypothetical protein [Planctomycetaceae bacterium]